MRGLYRNGQEKPNSPAGFCCAYLKRHRLRLVMILVLCSCICHFLILNFSGRNVSRNAAINIETERLQTPNIISMEKYEDATTTSTPISEPKPPTSWLDSYFAFIHSDGRSSVTDENASIVMVLPYSTKEKNISRELLKHDKRALSKLSEFLGAMKGFDGATCLLKPPTHNLRENADRARQHEDINSARNISLDSSWCRFLTRKWSVHIRNTGPVQNVQLPIKPFRYESSFTNETLPVEEMILLQSCNIVQGPFVIRKDAFNRIGGLLDSFGKVTLLEFFIRSKGQLKMAKLSNCAWTPEITRVDRGTLEGSNHFTEYGSFGNKHGILRIVTQSRIEWTACVANWKLCPEKPYVKPQDLPSIAAPICCSAVLSQMLADITWALTGLGLEYRIIYGTLLGAVRSKTIIPWTCDVDIALTKSAMDNASTFPAIEKFLRNQYYVGDSFMDTPRAHMLMAPYIEVDTAPFFDGPDDLEGNLLFSNDIEEAVKGMLPVSNGWRDRCYVDLYPAPSVWMNGSSLVTINNQQFVTLKEIDYELTNWYGKNYREPALKGNWVGFTDQGNA
ncbi:hypothetical protein OS493_005919 [Desmophyllum pertusum]|uniref:LicD/FKTN/FKRP nucleotidyltransferase domain-containing protein n=1 Tax=Desmophyllum pertusum TaxID=174260 RepID=A0A9X0CGL5_9CNID|nr:hypothetical protein OS493_005919 [Desmophyllum pertusum]